MLFAVNLFAISEHRDLLALWMFTSLSGVWYHVGLFMSCTPSWWISRKPIGYQRITSRFFAPFIFHIDMISVFVHQAIYRVLRPGYSICWSCVASGFVTSFVFQIYMIWLFVDRAMYSVLRPGYSVCWTYVTSGFLASFVDHIDMIGVFMNRAMYSVLRPGYSVCWKYVT